MSLRSHPSFSYIPLLFSSLASNSKQYMWEGLESSGAACIQHRSRSFHTGNQKGIFC